MKKEDINDEIISKIELQLEETLFYLPGETIKGKIILNPKYKMKIKNQILHLSLKLNQYEFWEFNKKEIKELKNIYITKVQENKIEYTLEKEELTKSEIFNSFSVIEEEKENKIISIPFEFKIENKNILPTFQFEDKNYILGIRHLLIVECKEYGSLNHIGLFIGKIKNEEYSEPKEIKQNFIVGLGSLEIKANFPKLSFSFNEEVISNIESKSNLHFKKVTQITQKFYRKIEWKGTLKSLINKNIYNIQKLQIEENKDEYGLISKLTFPIRPIIDSIIGGVLGFGFCFYLEEIAKFKDLFFKEKKNDEKKNYASNIIDIIMGFIIGIPTGIIGSLGGLGYGIYQQIDIVKDILKLKEVKKELKNDFEAKISNEDKELIIENLKKFVFFKDNKIVGFIKFPQNITPPVNGYYFNCNFKVKIEANISGIILNRNKNLKTQIDLYDSEEYIKKMKNIFKN
jgi:hypothetical protein